MASIIEIIMQYVTSDSNKSSANIALHKESISLLKYITQLRNIPLWNAYCESIFFECIKFIYYVE